VLTELVIENVNYVFKLYCHISGGLVLGKAKRRYNIFKSELPLVLEAIRYSDRALFKNEPYLDEAHVYVYFKSTDREFNKVEDWGNISSYT